MASCIGQRIGRRKTGTWSWSAGRKSSTGFRTDGLTTESAPSRAHDPPSVSREERQARVTQQRERFGLDGRWVRGAPADRARGRWSPREPVRLASTARTSSSTSHHRCAYPVDPAGTHAHCDGRARLVTDVNGEEARRARVLLSVRCCVTSNARVRDVRPASASGASTNQSAVCAPIDSCENKSCASRRTGGVRSRGAPPRSREGAGWRRRPTRRCRVAPGTRGDVRRAPCGDVASTISPSFFSPLCATKKKNGNGKHRRRTPRRCPVWNGRGVGKRKSRKWTVVPDGFSAVRNPFATPCFELESRGYFFATPSKSRRETVVRASAVCTLVVGVGARGSAGGTGAAPVGATLVGTMTICGLAAPPPRPRNCPSAPSTETTPCARSGLRSR